ncbi:hypothetical protein D3C80_1851560 [compost metagenome]
MADEPAPKLHIDPVGRVCQRVGAKILKHDVEKADRGKSDNKDGQRRVTTVGQHLVDHHLKKQRRDEGEELQEK